MTEPTDNRLAEQIKAALEENNVEQLRFLLRKERPEDIADACHTLHADECRRILDLLPPDVAGRVLYQLDPVVRGEIAELLDPRTTSDALRTLPPEEVADILGGLPEDVVDSVLGHMTLEESAEIQELMAYSPESAGGIMSPDVFALDEDTTVAGAIQALRALEEVEGISYLYVTDRERRLTGVMPLKRLITADDERMRLGDIATRDVISVRADADQEEVAHLIEKYDFRAIPVVGHGGVLIGRIKTDDIIDVIEEEATEDMQKIGSVLPLHTSVLNAPYATLYLRRVGWLVLLVFVNIFSGAGIAHFEELIESVVALVFFLPLLIDSGGNSGAQAATLIVRSLATGDVRTGDYLRLLFREIAVSLTLGISMAVAVFFLALYRTDMRVALVVSTSMVSIVIFGSLLGMSLPFILGRFKMDPATASAPLVTSVADVGGVLIYLSIANALLEITG